jgi:CheY-like chemotaxis protein
VKVKDIPQKVPPRESALTGNDSLTAFAGCTPPGKARGAERLNGACATHEAAQWEAVDRTISSLNPAVVLLDLGLLRSTGITDLSIIRRISRKTRVIALTESPNDAEGIAGLKAGARGWGYCDKGIDGALLLRSSPPPGGGPAARDSHTD